MTSIDRDTDVVLRSEAVLENSFVFDNETTINTDGVHYKNLGIEVQGKIGGLKSRQKAIFNITRDNPPE